MEYNIVIRTSHEAHSFSATEHSLLILCKIEVFTAATMNNAVFWNVKPCGSCQNRCFGGPIPSIIRVTKSVS
jgi:hypothetical protein